MTITPTWDLFIVVFFGLVITYSFIIGKNETIKVIISTYIAILAVEGIANVFERLVGDTTPLLQTVGLSMGGSQAVLALKLVIFVALIVFIAIRSGIEMEYSKDPGGPANIGLTALFGFATAGLLIISLIVFVTDVQLLDPRMKDAIMIAPILEKSKLMQVMILNQDLWFSLPALLLIAVGFISNEPLEE